MKKKKIKADLNVENPINPKANHIRFCIRVERSVTATHSLIELKSMYSRFASDFTLYFSIQRYLLLSPF